MREVGSGWRWRCCCLRRARVRSSKRYKKVSPKLLCTSNAEMEPVAIIAESLDGT